MFKVVVVPSTVKLPVTVRLPPTVASLILVRFLEASITVVPPDPPCFNIPKKVRASALESPTVIPPVVVKSPVSVAPAELVSNFLELP